MKKFFYLLACLAMPIFSCAQEEKNTFVESFREESSYWPDFKEKYGSGIAEDGYYVLTAKKEACGTIGRLPVQTDRNFKISFKLFCPKFTMLSSLGIVYDYKNEYDFRLIGLSENTVGVYHIYVPRQQQKEDEDPEDVFRNYLYGLSLTTMGYAIKKQSTVSEDGSLNISRIVLKKGSKKEIKVEIERKGDQLLLRVNGMDISKQRIEEDYFISNKFGFFVANLNGGKVLKIDEVSIKQAPEKE